MSLREELESIVASAKKGYVFPLPTLMFIRDHGDAMVEVFRDAERYRQLRMNFFHLPEGHLLVYSDDGTYLDNMDAHIDASIAARRNTYDQAIDAAIKGDGAKPTP